MKGKGEEDYGNESDQKSDMDDVFYGENDDKALKLILGMMIVEMLRVNQTMNLRIMLGCLLKES